MVEIVSIRARVHQCSPVFTWDFWKGVAGCSPSAESIATITVLIVVVVTSEKAAAKQTVGLQDTTQPSGIKQREDLCWGH
jgi:hypothetical protein